MTERQVFQEARFHFTEMRTDAIRATANEHYDSWKAGFGKLPNYVESWALEVMTREKPRTRATPMSRIGPVYEPTLFDQDCA